MTKGTLIAVLANAVGAAITVLLGVDWTHGALPGPGIWILAGLMAANAAVHALSGTDGLLSVKIAGDQSNPTSSK
jgi:hypothetical protein